MISKKGDEKYYIVISLILGIIVVALLLYFLFQEYFNQDELGWEVCRQSIVLRANIPEKDLAVATLSGKDELPLKCKTQVVNIDTKNQQEAEKQVADTIALCWSLIGEGQYEIFPKESWTSSDGEIATRCFICSRIHLESSAQEAYSGQNKSKSINIQRALDMKINSELTYYNYLNPKGSQMAFNYFKDFVSGGFNAEYIDKSSWTDVIGFFYAEAPDKGSIKSFSFPRYLDASTGDLFVIYAQSAEKTVAPYFLLVDEKGMSKLGDKWLAFGGADPPFLKVCGSIQSIPG